MSDKDMEIEALLARYRPGGPPVGLRDRILATARPRRLRWAVVGRLSLAAMLVLSLGLSLATERLTRQTVSAIRPAPLRWTPEVDKAVELLDGQGPGRRYIALALAADEPRIARLLRQNVPGGLLKEMQ